MTTLNPTKNSYEAVLADLRAQRDKIDNTINVLEAMSGLSLADIPGALNTSEAAPPEIASPNEPLGAGAFLGMSIVDAAKTLLATRKRQMGNKEIAKDLAAGGLVMNSADPINTVGSVLTRRFNQIGDVVRVGRGMWGLKEWYPNRSFKPTNKPQPILDNGKDHFDAAISYFEEPIVSEIPEEQHDL